MTILWGKRGRGQRQKMVLLLVCTKYQAALELAQQYRLDYLVSVIEKKMQ